MADQNFEAELKSLMEDIAAGKTENITQETLEKFTGEQIKEMAAKVMGRRYMIPVDKAVLDSPVKQSVFGSFIPMKQDYMMRLLTTGLIGATCQFMEEWTPSEEVRSWASQPAKNEVPFTSDEIFKIAQQQYSIAQKLVEQEQYLRDHIGSGLVMCERRDELKARGARDPPTESPDNVASEAGETEIDAAGAASASVSAEEQAEYEQLCKHPSRAELDVAERDALENIEALRYGYSYMLYKNGENARARLTLTKQQANKYPKAKKEIAPLTVPQDHNKFTMPEKNAKLVIREFFDNFFRFDPSLHIRAANSGGVDLDKTVKEATVNGKDMAYSLMDPHHVILAQLIDGKRPPKGDSQLRQDLNYITEQKDRYNTLTSLARWIKTYPLEEGADIVGDDVLAYQNACNEEAAKFASVVGRIFEDPDKYLTYLIPNAARVISPGNDTSNKDSIVQCIPPQDSFHRLNYYIEVNFDALNTVTRALYPERPDADAAIGIWKHVTGTDKEIEDQFQEHCNKFQDQAPCTISKYELGNWNIVLDNAKNRENIRIYNKSNEALKRIMDRHDEDKKLGLQLMSQRVRNSKAKNIKETGADAAGLSSYSSGQSAGMHGTERVLSDLDRLRLEKTHGDKKAADELAYFEELEQTIKTLSAKNPAELTSDEIFDLKYARENIERAKEQLSVPPKSVQVDVFETRGGVMTKSTMYTAEE